MAIVAERDNDQARVAVLRIRWPPPAALQRRPRFHHGDISTVGRAALHPSLCTSSGKKTLPSATDPAPPPSANPLICWWKPPWARRGLRPARGQKWPKLRFGCRFSTLIEPCA